MNRRALLSCLFAGFLSLPAMADGAKIKIACVGDSITAGVGAKKPNNSYPDQLGRLLGAGYEVRNFGNSGSTMLDEGDKPYKKQNSFTAALEYAADVYVIKLGTNDSKPQNWSKKAGFAASTQTLVEAFQKANPKAKVYLCTPVPVIGAGNFGINNEMVQGEIIPLIKQVAAAMKLPVIDLYAALDGHPEMFPDRVHPNDDGATLIAKTVHEALK
ncbi:MAG: putative xylanase [Verrucomicrobiaceae bacterium]|nr:putative xylanase [Verrucomicrobiaceae bacterium]